MGLLLGGVMPRYRGGLSPWASDMASGRLLSKQLVTARLQMDPPQHVNTDRGHVPACVFLPWNVYVCNIQTAWRRVWIKNWNGLEWSGRGLIEVLETSCPLHRWGGEGGTTSTQNVKLSLWELVRYGLDWSSSGYGTVEGSCEHGNEPSGSIKCWEVLEWFHKRRSLEQVLDPCTELRFTNWVKEAPECSRVQLSLYKVKLSL
jgi:hypothetical protein